MADAWADIWADAWADAWANACADARAVAWADARAVAWADAWARRVAKRVFFVGFGRCESVMGESQVLSLLFWLCDWDRLG